MSTEIKSKSDHLHAPWNKGRLVGQKRPLRPKEVWAIRVRLQIKHSKRIGTIEEPSDRLDFRLGRHLTGSEGVEADNHDGVGVGDQCISSSGVLTPSSLTRS
jgi:hypothetical protein